MRALLKEASRGRFTGEPLLQEARRRGALAAAAAARGPAARPPPVPGHCPLGAASPLLRRPAAPHYRAGGHLAAGSGTAEGSRGDGAAGRGSPRTGSPARGGKLERAGAGLRFTPEFPSRVVWSCKWFLIKPSCLAACYGVHGGGGARKRERKEKTGRRPSGGERRQRGHPPRSLRW